jgi:hypothetical protein
MLAHPVRGHPMGDVFEADTKNAAQVLMARIAELEAKHGDRAAFIAETDRMIDRYAVRREVAKRTAAIVAYVNSRAACPGDCPKCTDRRQLAEQIEEKYRAK